MVYGWWWLVEYWVWNECVDGSVCVVCVCGFDGLFVCVVCEYAVSAKVWYDVFDIVGVFGENVVCDGAFWLCVCFVCRVVVVWMRCLMEL